MKDYTVGFCHGIIECHLFFCFFGSEGADVLIDCRRFSSILKSVIGNENFVFAIEKMIAVQTIYRNASNKRPVNTPFYSWEAFKRGGIY